MASPIDVTFPARPSVVYVFGLRRFAWGGGAYPSGHRVRGRAHKVCSSSISRTFLLCGDLPTALLPSPALKTFTVASCLCKRSNTHIGA